MQGVFEAKNFFRGLKWLAIQEVIRKLDVNNMKLQYLTQRLRSNMRYRNIFLSLAISTFYT